MAVSPILSLTEQQALIALRSFLLSSVRAGTEIVLGQVNQVPEPRSQNFVVFWPLRYERLGTNETTYTDAAVVGSVSGSVLTVTQVDNGAIQAGMVLLGTGLSTVLADTVVSGQLTGSVGGTGTYTVSKSQTVLSGSMYLGLRDDMAALQMTVQLDVHGPESANNAFMIETLFRSAVAGDAFEARGYAVVPLYADTARQMPFVNQEQQYENRWVVEASMQINPVTSTPMQFADELVSETIEVDTAYPP